MSYAGALYLDTSAVLRAVLEGGTTPEMERAIGTAGTLITSRLSLVEAEVAFIRLRASGGTSEERLADVGREIASGLTVAPLRYLSIIPVPAPLRAYRSLAG